MTGKESSSTVANAGQHTNVAAAFRSRAASYDIDTPWVRDPVVVGHALSLLRRRPIGDLLDAGGGTGALAALVGNALEARSVLVVDISREMLQQVAPAFRVKHAPIESLSRSRGRFDTILLRQVLHYLGDPWGALAHLAALLRPGGRITLAKS